MATRYLRPLSLAFAVAGGGVACIVAAMTVTSIVMRSLLSRPIPGDVELTQLGIALAISLCLPWAQLHGANIIVDFFTQSLEPRANRRLDAVGALLLAAMCALLSWRTSMGALAVHAAGETSMILDLPMWWVYAALAPGLALTALIALVQAARCWRGGALVEN
ncbi:MAG TPA: TRAP transporter small permease [Ideonella sp.]|nr:TRAP transporter small permease [Ideonella sp.]